MWLLFLDCVCLFSPLLFFVHCQLPKAIVYLLKIVTATLMAPEMASVVCHRVSYPVFWLPVMPVAVER